MAEDFAAVLNNINSITAGQVQTGSSSFCISLWSAH